MKARIIGFVLLVIVLGILFVYVENNLVSQSSQPSTPSDGIELH
jgi:hypothetical protein